MQLKIEFTDTQANKRYQNYSAYKTLFVSKVMVQDHKLFHQQI